MSSHSYSLGRWMRARMIEKEEEIGRAKLAAFVDYSVAGWPRTVERAVVIRECKISRLGRHVDCEVTRTRTSRRFDHELHPYWVEASTRASHWLSCLSAENECQAQSEWYSLPVTATSLTRLSWLLRLHDGCRRESLRDSCGIFSAAHLRNANQNLHSPRCAKDED